MWFLFPGFSQKRLVIFYFLVKHIEKESLSSGFQAPKFFQPSSSGKYLCDKKQTNKWQFHLQLDDIIQNNIINLLCREKTHNLAHKTLFAIYSYEKNEYKCAHYVGLYTRHCCKT